MTKKEMTFEAALAELQTVVERLEAGKVSLDDSLALYERGMELVAFCNKRLDAAEQRVSAVKMGADGAELTPFATEAAE